MVGNISKNGVRGADGKDGHTPSITFRYDADTGNLYCDSDGILVDKEYVDSKNLVTKEYLNYVIEQLKETLGLLSAKSIVKTITISLPATAWEKDADNRYSQVVDIEGVTEYSKIDLQPDAGQLAIFHEKDITFVTENEGGKITVYCIGQKPMNDYNIQATITEVETNE